MENKKQRKIDSGGFRKHEIAKIYSEPYCTERQWDAMQAGQAEAMVMEQTGGDCDPAGGDHNTQAPSLDSFNLRTRKGADQFEFETKSYSETKKFAKQRKELHSKEPWMSRTPSDEYSKSSSNGEEKIMSESADNENLAETPGEQEETFVPSVKYNFDNPLVAITYSEDFKTSEENFTKGCKWSPDGSCLLVAANDSRMRLFNLPSPVLQGSFLCESWFAEEAKNYSTPAVIVREKELVYDYCWYPLMRSDSPTTCCFVATCRDQPIHLWDAWDGHLICSYHSYNHLDEMVAAYSVGFNLDGSRMVAGFKKCLRTFHTQRPGRYFEQIEAKEHPGIISCTSFNPQMPAIFAAGSYLGSIGLYNLERNNLFCRIDGDMGGVTQVKFSSCGTKLFSGSRKNNEILCWDIRNPGTLLCGYKREVSTSQRIYFDLEPHSSSFLVSGDTGGRVLKWDLNEGWEAASDDEFTKEPSSSFVAHKDCTNGVSIHPYCPVLATSSGQRHFPEPVSGSDLDSSSDSEEPKGLFTNRRALQENAVKLWWLGGI